MVADKVHRQANGQEDGLGEEGKKAKLTFRVGCRLDHHGVVHVAQEELMGCYSGLVAAHGHEGSARGFVVCPYCQQLHCSDSF